MTIGIRTRALLVLAAVGGGTAVLCRPAQALPAFSRRTGMQCTACHDSWPRLNDFGELYRDRGYRLGNLDDDAGVPLQYFPISFRVTVGYSYTAMTNQPSDTGPRDVNTGAFVTPAADIYFAAALSNHLSAYVDIAGFSADGTAKLESSWVRINDIGNSHWLNLKLGVLELDLPLSMHRAFTIFSPFLIYDYHPAGSINPFILDENQRGIEISGHENGPGLRYALALTTSGDLAGASPLSTPTLYGHVTYTRLTWSPIVPRVRVGAMGNIGWVPTNFAPFTPPGGAPAPISGTGTDSRSHGHVGGDLQLVFLSLAQPITLTGVWMYGQENAALVQGGTRNAHFHGGFVQLDYIPIFPLVVGVRYDGVYNTQQADPTAPSDANQQVAFTLYFRYALWLSAWGSGAVHLEASTLDTQGVGADGGAVRSNSVFAGVDLML
jgi:hypothetical protein